ncbi:hypothetical protein BKP45_10115 [Anaerobacillus alkalidiazotrophicus]|uniref:PTS EIIB type-2 domain-containing protein n=1 Tax=Anaerobacillus alkalidiazotrophicus TaxID=472963 RepID=A0A1S2M6K4_9BACI|nr:hypothetical protein [Anaerobacillus alkalidiazotrophicus]OIJ20133.1 hypothetical protein BKP45_10115 [Anaerobacillus alkalidiazotrophicus]
MKRIAIVCSSGLGTSLMLRIHLEHILKEWNIQANVMNIDKSSITSEFVELIIGAKQIVDSIEMNRDMELIGLEDIVDKQYLRSRLEHSTTIQQWLQLK